MKCSNPVLLGGKRECFLCAMQAPKKFETFKRCTALWTFHNFKDEKVRKERIEEGETKLDMNPQPHDH